MRYEYEVGDYVETIANKSCSSHPIGYIGKITRIDNFPKCELAGYWANLDEHPSGWSHISEIKISTKEAYDIYHKPKLPECKFKVGDKVKLLVDKVSKSFYTEALHYSNRLLQDSNSVFIVEAITSNGVPQWNNQFIRVKGYDYEHPIACFELYTEPQFKIGDWAITTMDTHECVHKPKANEIFKIKEVSDSNLLFDVCQGVALKRCRLATESEVKEYLLKEADRRGFKAGVSYIPTTGGSSEVALNNPRFYDSGLSVYDLECGAGRGLIYKYTEDKWATIVPKTKILCGHQVLNPEGSSIISIGCKSISKGEIQGFLNVCEKFDITRVQSSYVKDTITLQDIKEALK